MTIKNTLNQAAKTALKEKQKDRLSVIRMALAAIKQVEVDERIEVPEDRELAILDKMIKQRKDAFQQFKSAGREDLAQKESFEIDLLKEYLPQPFSDDEIKTLIETTITEVGAASIRDMGKVMGAIKPKLQGRADLGKASGLIKSLLDP